MAESTQIILDPSAHHHRTGKVWQAHHREWLRRGGAVEHQQIQRRALKLDAIGLGYAHRIG